MLTDDMKRVILEQKLGFVASVNEDGTPNLSPKATFIVLDDRAIAFAELRSPNTMANIARNSAVEVNFVDPFIRKGYRFQGRATAAPRASAAFPDLFAAFGNLGSLSDHVRAIVRIDIEEAVPLVSPAYDRGLTEKALRRGWTQKFRAIQPGGVFDTGN
jgi:predicted pyridoxine 5'-phosphate oxidase superfamily flavin-nucleotide-binding protein